MSSNNCPPLKLPIHIETSCGGSNYSKYSECSSSNGCTIDSTLTFQGKYQNECCKDFEKFSSLTVAYLSNERNCDCEPDTSITLDPICIDWCDFLVLFYRINNSFSILPSATNSCLVSFFGRTYENTTSQNVKFNLSSFVRTTWAQKCETTVSNIPIRTSVLLNRDVSFINSLADAKSAITLSLDQAIETLIANGEITPADSTQSAKVAFIVDYKYVFKPLNTAVLVKFAYVTKIPCYKNINFCDTWCPPYSRDTCNTCPDLKASSQDDILKYLSKNNYETESTTGFSDNTSLHEEDTIGDDLKDFNKDDDKTFISVDSSKW
jgi:hypothetical protein